MVRQALEKALLQANEDFWAANPPDPNAMDQQDPFRRNKLAMQFFLRLHVLVACKGGPLTPPLVTLTHSFTQNPCVVSLPLDIVFLQMQVMRSTCTHLHSEQVLQSVQSRDSAVVFRAHSKKCPGPANA